MKLSRVCLRLAWLLVPLCSPVSAQASEKPLPKVHFSSVKTDLTEYIDSQGDRQDRAFEKLKKKGYERVCPSKSEFTWLEKRIRASRRRLEVEKGVSTLDLTIGGKKLAVHTFVPAKYDPSRRAPLVIALHGGGGEMSYDYAAEAAMDEIKSWTQAATAAGALVVAPSTTGPYWVLDSGKAIILAALSHAHDTLNIDPDRVALCGSSLGGFGTFHWAPVLADRLALAAPFVGGSNDHKHRLENCRDLPFHISIGLKDWMVQMIPWVQDNAQTLKSFGYDVTFHEHAGVGHAVPPGEYQEVAAKLLKCPRKPYPVKLTRVDGTGLWYWIEAEGRIDAEIDGNTISIKGPKKATVYLSDHMVALEKPVRVVLNGDIRFEGVVLRSLGVTIESLRATGDPGRVFAARVSVESL
jgi:predicted esterase